MARASMASLNGVAVACALTRPTFARADARVRERGERRAARPDPVRSGAVMCTASFDAPKPATRASTGAPRVSSPRTSATTAAPSPSDIPSRPTRKGRGRDAVVARSTSKPAATKTLTPS